ncbi:MAG: DnaA/Hda family protein [Alphaproteobacteria bacterium]|jgi:chromosomal replication initiation ATPase DnaA|nr:DNA replication protein [Rhodospirillaceae bacterium]MDP6403992.1 DnaA/Hda family protein [Alphaproteobacteria bacterium]MDP6623335.1 DnaA/Hda family protein [Alphaproteobacteria bacterium]|tara:strand:+ start:1417 stop:2094 length:678 start_codon:yes stop_codon:yes gene_type:complete
MTAQLAFDLAQRPALGAEDFLVAESNAEAVSWLDRWPDWPGRALALHGPPGSGKSHLVHVWQAATGGTLLNHEDVAAARGDLMGPGATAVALDDADRAPQNEALLHLYNGIVEAGGTLLLTGQTPPARWEVALADLRSRLRAIPAVAVLPPDDALLAALLVKLFADRQLRVAVDLVHYLVGRLERSPDAARRAVVALDEGALAKGREITVPLAREVLFSKARAER